MENNPASQAQARLSYEVAVYREQLRLLEKEIERINLTTMDLSNAAKTIENLKNEEALVPVGGGVFIRTKVESTKTLVPVGADYLVETEKENAVSEIRKRVEATKKAIEKLTEEFDKIAKRLQEGGMKLRELRQIQAITKNEGEPSDAYL